MYSKSNFMVRSIDLLSALFNATGNQSQVLLVQSDLLQSLKELIKFKDNTVKQYVFGLLGDMIKNSGQIISPHLPTFIAVALEHL